MIVITSDAGQTYEPAPGATLRMIDGTQYGLGAVALIISEYPPGAETPVHRHTYTSAIVVVGGHGVFNVEDEEQSASVGDVVVVPARAWHAFRNDGDDLLRVVGVDMGGGQHTTELRDAVERQTGGA